MSPFISRRLGAVPARRDAVDVSWRRHSVSALLEGKESLLSGLRCPPPSPLSWSPTVFLFSVLLLTICPVSLAWFVSSSGQLCPNNARNCVVGHRGEVRSIWAPWKLTGRVHPVFISISVSGQVSFRLVSYSVITGGYELNKCLNDFLKKYWHKWHFVYR